MAGNLIVTTPKTSMHALAFQGIMVYTCFPQLRDMLLRKFGDEYVLLFSRPEENLADGNIDWYTPVQGEARKVIDLPKEEADQVYEKLALMAQDIHKYAEELISTNEPLKVTRGNILALSLRYPDNNALYVVGGQPVFTCWGFGPGSPGVEGMDLFKLKAPAPVKPTAPPQEKATQAPIKDPQPVTTPGRHFGCLPWVIPALLLALLLALIFGGIGDQGSLSGCTLFRTPPLISVEDHKGEIDALQAEIDAYKKKLAEKAALCVPSKETPQARAEAPKQDLVIPGEARNSDFLEGKWLCETGLVNDKTYEPVQLEFTFGKNGVGTATTYEKDDQCGGSTRAHLNNGALEISVSVQTCAKSGKKYSPITIRCEDGPGGVAICKGTHQDGATWDAKFKKIQ